MIFFAMSRWQPHPFSVSGVDRHHGALDRHHVEKRGNGDDSVGFLVHFHLAQHLAQPQALARGEGGDHVDRLLRAFLLIRAARCLAVDGDDLSWRVGQRRDKGDEATLESLRIQRSENIVQMIMPDDHAR